MKVLVFDLSTQGLEATKHRIVGITCKWKDEQKVITNRDEKVMLQEFWDYVKREEFTHLAGFNSDKFDIPFLIVRNIKHKIPVPEIVNKSLDLRKIAFHGIDVNKGKLKEFKEMLGIEFPDSRYAKMHMSLLWEAPHLDDLKEFLLEDVKITWSLYEHVREVGLV